MERATDVVSAAVDEAARDVELSRAGGGGMPAGPLLLVDDAHLVLDRTLSRLLGARYDTRVVSLDAEAALSVLSQPPPSRCAGRTNTRRSI